MFKAPPPIGEAGATISQDISISAAGEYQDLLRVGAAGLWIQGTDLAVKMDGATLGTVPHGSQLDDVWRTFSVPYVCTTPGLHRLSFVGTRAGDFASALDGVQIVGRPGSRCALHPPPGLRTAKLSINNNDPDEDPYELTLTGTGAVSPRFQSLAERVRRLAMSGPTTWARTCLPPPALAGWRVSRSSRSKTPARLTLRGSLCIGIGSKCWGLRDRTFGDDDAGSGMPRRRLP